MVVNIITISQKFIFSKKDFKYFIDYKDNIEISSLCILFPEISIYKIYSDKSKCMCLMIKDESIFDKYMTV